MAACPACGFEYEGSFKFCPECAAPQGASTRLVVEERKVVVRARELLPGAEEQEVFDQLIHEIYPTPGGRVPKIVTSVAGTAIYQVKHER